MTTKITEADFNDLFASRIDAKNFEDRALSIGREFLPEFAQSVLDGGEATPEYWAWLHDQAVAY